MTIAISLLLLTGVSVLLIVMGMAGEESRKTDENQKEKNP